MTSLPGTIRQGKDAPPPDSAKVAGLLTTASVPAAQRLDFWREVVCHTIAGVEANALTEEHPYAGAIHAQSIPLAHMPSFDLVHVEADPQRVNRTRALISIQPEPTWLLMVQGKGTCTIRQAEQQTTLETGDIGFLDTARPYEVIFPQTFKQSILRMPTPLFHDIVPKNRDLAGMALSGDDALTAIARQNIVLLERFVSAIEPMLLPAAANRALDHLALATRSFFEGNIGRRGHNASAFYFARACAYISESLGDPFLSIEKIAEAVGLSSGHLQQVFRQSSGGTVGEYVRERRLAGCRRDLADASLAHQSITSIAFRWGFSESSSLSRAFRNAFQTSPRRYRNASRQDASGS
ncbi:transcriptional regulator, AraC family [Bradyrhizobium lablabi]|uniref:Transcriptional regulator, AraC family n=1 Tax=Bradyrhizobium lablabi TaxID=722472 RepID=A0A1M7D4T4_9BRAD|nr:helix-turn-helix domain-containing protein [Bradyrhizobium lablabi]SHL74438.1 transcriptional regulator, AraC family [Bradyrhizobium lablabi]